MRQRDGNPPRLSEKAGGVEREERCDDLSECVRAVCACERARTPRDPDNTRTRRGRESKGCEGHTCSLGRGREAPTHRARLSLSLHSRIPLPPSFPPPCPSLPNLPTLSTMATVITKGLALLNTEGSAKTSVRCVWRVERRRAARAALSRMRKVRARCRARAFWRPLCSPHCPHAPRRRTTLAYPHPPQLGDACPDAGIGRVRGCNVRAGRPGRARVCRPDRLAKLLQNGSSSASASLPSDTRTARMPSGPRPCAPARAVVPAMATAMGRKLASGAGRLRGRVGRRREREEDRRAQAHGRGGAKQERQAPRSLIQPLLALLSPPLSSLHNSGRADATKEFDDFTLTASLTDATAKDLDAAPWMKDALITARTKKGKKGGGGEMVKSFLPLTPPIRDNKLYPGGRSVLL